MSDVDNNTTCDENYDEVDDGYTKAISALATREQQNDTDQILSSASQDFQYLDEMLHQGMLSGAKMSNLKAQYTNLHETLSSIREKERQLLDEAEEITKQIEIQRAQLAMADDHTGVIDTKANKLREELLKHRNSLDETQEREYHLQFKTQSLKEEKGILEREYERLPKQLEIEQRTNALHISNEEFQKEIGSYKMEAKGLKEDLIAINRQIVADKREFGELHKNLEELKTELVLQNSHPGQIVKETDKIAKMAGQLGNQLRLQDEEFLGLINAAKELEYKRKRLEDEKVVADDELDIQRIVLNQRMQELNLLIKEYELAKEKEAVLLGDRATLDMSLHHFNIEWKTQHNVHLRKMREQERDTFNLKKAEIHLKVVEEALNHIKSVYKKLKEQRNASPKDDDCQIKKREDVRKEVEHAKRALAQQNSLTAVEHVMLEASAAEEQNLMYEQSDLRIEVVELTRLAAIKAEEREQKARDYMRAEMRYRRAVEDLKTKQLQIYDHRKNCQEMHIKLANFAKLYDVIKEARNKCVTLIQLSTQKAAEMRERMKILQNEIEILRTVTLKKDSLLHKQQLRKMNSIVVHDGLRNEMSSQHHQDQDMRDVLEQHEFDMSSLNIVINSREKHMINLRKCHEKSIQHRNERGVKLIERNEEVCVFYEKINVQGTVIKNGEMDMKAREEDIKFLKMRFKEEERLVDLLRKSIPCMHYLNSDLFSLQVQLRQYQEQNSVLEKQIEYLYDEKRVRFVGSDCQNHSKIQMKIEDLEKRLMEKDESMLEKELIFEQVQHLVERSDIKVSSSRIDTLCLAKKVNDARSRINDATHKVMALVSELSMVQAQALNLQQQVRDRESELEMCYKRMEIGEAPSLLLEKEWNEVMNNRNHDIKARLTNLHSHGGTNCEPQQYELTSGIYMTAQPRPNAYLPDDDSDLPIPHPYGHHAPFKPTGTGSTMRHTRKPVPRPIEI